MKRHNAILDISARLVHLNSPVYGKVTLHLPAISRIKASLHHMVERRLEDIHVVRYVSECDTCRKVKADYMKPGGLLQPLSVPEWKWDDISMDFIVGLLLTARKFNSIWVIVDRLTKSTHFIPVNTNYNVQKYAEIYVARVLCLHVVSKTIISDRGSQFIAHFWEQLHASLGTHLIHSSAYHPQMDGQTERVNQILEDMLRACVM
jgi:hypothetical protein